MTIEGYSICRYRSVLKRTNCEGENNRNLGRGIKHCQRSRVEESKEEWLYEEQKKEFQICKSELSSERFHLYWKNRSKKSESHGVSQKAMQDISTDWSTILTEVSSLGSLGTKMCHGALTSTYGTRVLSKSNEWVLKRYKQEITAHLTTTKATCL